MGNKEDETEVLCLIRNKATIVRHITSTSAYGILKRVKPSMATVTRCQLSEFNYSASDKDFAQTSGDASGDEILHQGAIAQQKSRLYKPKRLDAIGLHCTVVYLPVSRRN